MSSDLHSKTILNPAALLIPQSEIRNPKSGKSEIRNWKDRPVFAKLLAKSLGFWRFA